MYSSGMETTFSIHQVAERTGLSIDTLRYYERIRLLEPVARKANGHRRYRQKDIDWISLLIDLKETGMPLASMLHFAELRRQGNATAAERLLLLEQHQRSLEQQIRKLEQHMVALQEKIAHKKAFLEQQTAEFASAAGELTEEIEAFALEDRDDLERQEEKGNVYGDE